MRSVRTRKVYSSAKENELVDEYRQKGYYAIRAPSSMGVADLIVLRPPTCGHCACPDLFQAKFIQVKTSEKLREKSITVKAEEVEFGYVNVEHHFFPVKNKAYWAAYKKRKEKELKRLAKRSPQRSPRVRSTKT